MKFRCFGRLLSAISVALSAATGAVAAQEPTAPPTPAAERALTIASEATPGFGSYSYDGSGNITAIDTHLFRYDPFGRLQKAILGSIGSPAYTYEQAYTYDRYGNILTIVRVVSNSNGSTVDTAKMSVDPATNQMDLPFSQSDANLIAQYDAAGNLIEHQEDQFVYDALNMMKETTDPIRRLHIYSASDERVGVVIVENNLEKSSEWTLRDGSSRVLRRLRKDTTGAWQWKEDYIYGGAHLLAAEVPGSERVRHFHVDHLGTPRLITGNGGVQIAEKTYEPFGVKLSATTLDYEQLEFTGHERDVPTLDYMHARYYQPYLGRFLSVDPKSRKTALGTPQLYNGYSYALNDPLNNVDLDGEDVTPVRVVIQNKNAPVAKPRVAYVDSRMVPRLQNLVTSSQKQGVSFTFNNLLRTPDQQDSIKTGNTKNKKGTSPHTAGLALDINVSSSLKGTDLAGLTKLARGADLSPLSNQSADPPHFQANDLITRGKDGLVDDQFKALVQENQRQVEEFEKMRQECPEAFERAVVEITPTP